MEKNGVLLAHVPEPVVSYGGRAGWGGVVLLSHTYRSQYFVWWKGGVGRSGTPLAHVPEPIFSYGGRAGWRMMGWVAVFACYWTSATLLAHVPEPIVLHGQFDIFAWMFCLVLSYGSKLYIWGCFISVIVTGC